MPQPVCRQLLPHPGPFSAPKGMSRRLQPGHAVPLPNLQLAAGLMPGSSSMVDVSFTLAGARYRGRLVKSGRGWALAATLNGNPLRVGTSFPVAGTKVVFFPGSPGTHGRLQIDAGEGCCWRHGGLAAVRVHATRPRIARLWRGAHVLFCPPASLTVPGCRRRPRGDCPDVAREGQQPGRLPEREPGGCQPESAALTWRLGARRARRRVAANLDTTRFQPLPPQNRLPSGDQLARDGVSHGRCDGCDGGWLPSSLPGWPAHEHSPGIKLIQ